MYQPACAVFVRSPAFQRQNHIRDRLLTSLQIDYPGWQHSLYASYQIAAALFLVTGGSSVPTCHLDARDENSDTLFSRAADHAATSATNNRFGEDRKCRSRSCASHAHADDLFVLRLAGMVGFSTIEYHSGRLGKFVVIWSSDKFAQPLLF